MRSSSLYSVEVHRWTQTREAQAEEMFLNLIIIQFVAVIALGFQALQFPPLPGIELAFYGKICQIGPLPRLVELENRKVALNGAASWKSSR
jgi:hypothetical protein